MSVNSEKLKAIHDTLPVSDFERRGQLDYPARRPETHFITDGEQVTMLDSDPNVALEQIAEYLEQHNLPGLEDRIPVLAYGANASPGNLKTKFSKYNAVKVDGREVPYLADTDITETELQTTPCIYAELLDQDVVWHGRPGQVGGYFAELYKGEETRGSTVQTVIQFLTPEQLAVMHTTEGVTYEFASIGSMKFGEHTFNQIVSYVAREASVLLDDEGKPISVAGIQRSNSQLKEWNAHAATQYTLDDLAVIDALGRHYSPEEYVEEGQAMKLADKKVRQATVQTALQYAGKTRSFRYETADQDIFTTGGFSNLPRFNREGRVLTNDDGKPAIGYVEFAALGRLRRDPEKRAELTKQYKRQFPDKTNVEISKMVDPILHRLGELSWATAKEYIPES